MHVGLCLNCRYIDLMENVGTAPNAGAVCPRCGIEMSSLGVRTDEWNALSAKGKDKLIREKFPTHEELFGTQQDDTDEAVEEVETAETVEPVRESPETAEFPDDSAEEVSEGISEESPKEQEQADEPEDSGETVNIKELFGEAATAGLDVFGEDGGVEEASAEESEPDEYDLNRVYVCYKCNSVASHDGAQERYYCYECGSGMVGTGYTIRQWSDLSKEEKRKVTEDAKLMHMLSEIKRDDYGDGGPDHTPSIINVVKDPNKVY